MSPDYSWHLIALFAIYGIAGLGMNLALGWTGIIQLGYAGSMALGAYGSALLSTRWGAPVGVSIFGGMVLAGCVTSLLNVLSRRVRGDAMSVILLGFNFIVIALALNLTDLTRGSLGIPGVPRPAGFENGSAFAAMAIFLTLICAYVIHRITASPYGRVMAAIRDDELHARTLGKRTARVTATVLGLSGALAGLSGALLAHFIRFIEPNSFFLIQLVFVLSLVFVGGLASVRGTLLGAAIMVFVPELVRFIPGLPTEQVGAVRGILFSLLLLCVVLYRPKGLLGRVTMPNSFAPD